MMKTFQILAAGAMGLAAIAAPATAAAPDMPAAQEWTIGPIIKGRNYSEGMPLHPRQAGEGISFEFPGPTVRDGHVHYVTYDPGSLAGARRIVFEYRIDAAPGTEFRAREQNGHGPVVSLYFQRRGDNWSAARGYEQFRWYAPPSSVKAVAPGTYRMTVSLDDNWGNVNGQRRAGNERAFEAALDNAGSVGFVFGTPPARGHGVYATGPARITVLDFRVE